MSASPRPVATRRSLAAIGLASGMYLCCVGQPARAADADPLHARPWKLTVGHYFYGDYAGDDLNLRWRRGDTDAWAGVYTDRAFGTQARIGADTAITLSELVQLQPSLQAATQGFVGGSLNLQIGNAWYGYGGIGRTNLKPYFNLNFDPNDAVTLGVGHRTPAGDVYALFVVADDRLHTGQRDWHVTARRGVAGMRATLDILRKSGRGDAGYVTGWGATVTWDFPRWFLRVARDPYQNFSAQDAWRIAAGARF